MVYLNSFGKIVTLLQLHFNSQFQAITIWNCVTPKDLTKFLRLQYWFSSPVGFLSLPSELVNPLKISLQHNKFLICMELGDRICHYWGGGGGGGGDHTIGEKPHYTEVLLGEAQLLIQGEILEF